MKKTVAAAMALGCCLAAFGGGTARGMDVYGMPWTFVWRDDGTATIGTGSEPTPEDNAKYTGSVVVPATVYREGEPYKVTAIAENALYGCTLMESVTIPAGVASIGNAAFKNCGNLEHVTFKSTFPTSSNFKNVFEGTKFYTNASAENANDLVTGPVVFPSDGSVKTVKDSNFLAGVDSDEDWASISSDHGTGCATKWFTWTPQKSGTVWFDTTASVFDTLLYVYRADTKAEVAKNDDFTKTGGSQVTFKAEAGVEYYICVGGKNGERGAYTLALRTGTPVTLTLDPNGGAFSGVDVPKKFTVPKGVAVGALPTPEKANYTCAWYTRKSGGTKVTAKTKFTKNTKLYAQWTKTKFKVEVFSVMSIASKVKGAGTYAWGTKVKLSVAPASGYVFSHWNALGSASRAAFPKYDEQRRKNASPTVTVPKTSGLAYEAFFVKKSSDTLSISAPSGTTLYAEDGVGTYVLAVAGSVSYPTVTTSKLPAGVKFARNAGSDFVYRLSISDAAKVPPGRHVVKVTAKNRSGKKATKSFVVVGNNKTQAINKGALTMTGSFTDSAKTPNELYAGMKYGLADFGLGAASGWKITKIAGLPSGMKWDSKKQKLTGYATKVGTSTLTITVAKGKTKYTATATYAMQALPPEIASTFSGLTSEHDLSLGFVAATSHRFTATVSSVGKVSAKVGDVSFSGAGLVSDTETHGLYVQMKSNYTKNKTTYYRTLNIYINSAAQFHKDSMTGSFITSSKKGANTSPMKLEQVFARRNVFGKDANDAYIFEAGHEALEKAIQEYDGWEYPDHGVRIVLSSKEGFALVADINNPTTCEEVPIFYEYEGGFDSPTRYLRFRSLLFDKSFYYKLNYSGSTLQSVEGLATDPKG